MFSTKLPTHYPLQNVTGLAVRNASYSTRAKTFANATDESGNTILRTGYGAENTYQEWTMSFDMVSSGSGTGGILSGNLVLGANPAQGADFWTESLSVSTSNGGWPQLSVKFRTGLVNVSGAAFTVALPGIKAEKTAQSLGVSTTVAKARMQSTSASWTCSFSETTSQTGAPAAASFFDCKAEATATAVVIDDDDDGNDAFVVDAAWTGHGETNSDALSVNQEALAYGTVSATASKIIVPDVPAV